MNRSSTVVGLTALTLALLVGCGKESASGSPCRDEYVKLYQKVLKLLRDESPTDPNIDNRMRDTLGFRPPKKCQDPRVANPILDQVAHQFGPALAALEGKWGRDNLSGFRDPLNAGHGPPLNNKSVGSSSGPRAAAE
jgi:hypothetical protein